MRRNTKSIADRLCDEGFLECLSYVLANTLIPYDSFMSMEVMSKALALRRTSLDVSFFIHTYSHARRNTRRLCVAKPTLSFFGHFLSLLKNQVSSSHDFTANRPTGHDFKPSAHEALAQQQQKPKATAYDQIPKSQSNSHGL